MAKQTAADRAALKQAAEEAQALLPEDAANLLVLLDRVQTKGVQEASVLAICAHKLTVLKGNYKGATSGKDVPTTD
jgi:hypothetical protein